MRLALAVLQQVILGLEPFRALDTVVGAQTGQVLDGFGVCVSCEVRGIPDVGVHLVDCASVAPHF